MARSALKPQTTLITLPDAVDLIRFEKNLLQIGFFGAHEKRGKALASSRRIEQWVNRDGKKIRVSAEFRSSDALGLPSTSDRDKYMAFMKLAMEKRVQNGVLMNPIRFSGYGLLSALGQCDSGENYEALNSWGMRMADTTITSEQVIYSSLRKRYMNKTVHVFRSFTRLGASDVNGGNRTDVFEVELEDWLLENLNESFVVPEDFNTYRKLTRPTAKGIFVYLYLWFYASQGKEVEKDYTELCALLNVRTYGHVSKIRETMGLSLDELVSIDYLKCWDIRPMSSKAGYKLVLSPGRALKDVLVMTQRRQLAFDNSQPENSLNGAREVARKALIEHGVSAAKAGELARKHDPIMLADKVEYVASQLSEQRCQIKNPAGYIISFVEGEQPIPTSFQTARQRNAKVEEVARQEASRRTKDQELLLHLEQRDRYERWCFARAEELISGFSEDLLAKRLKLISSQLRRKQETPSALDRLSTAVRREQLMKVLRREVVKEMSLPCFQDWSTTHMQSDLFPRQVPLETL